MDPNSDGYVRDPDDFPPHEHLRFWWDCQRKLRYATEAEAEEANRPFAEQGSGTVPYVCKYGPGQHWHNGKPLGREGSSKKTSSGRSKLRRQWVRQIKKATPEELAEHYEEAVKR